MCAGVETSLTTYYGIVNDIISETTPPGTVTKTVGTLFETGPITTVPDNTVYDLNGQRLLFVL